MDDDDEGFLAELAAAEAEAVFNSASKRRRFDSLPQKTVSVAAPVADVEGAYTAALKGRNSLLWQQQQQQQQQHRVVAAEKVFGSFQSSGGTDSDACFKCGKTGHWSRDCVAAGNSGIGGSDDLIPEKICSCGMGNCLVLTANTEKNRGRKFYRCPVRQENGGCGFFEWCDNSSGSTNMTGASQNFVTTSTFPNLPCPCGAGSCLILTAKTGNNIGQQFYRCPASQESSCGYFKWCNSQTVAAPSVINQVFNNASNNTYETSTKSYGSMNSSSCFKCGKEGHWAKDCSIPSSDSTGDSGGRPASTGGTCYKCNQPGHWAKDCSMLSFDSTGDSGGRSASTGGTCYKCNQPGHWAKDCSMPSFDSTDDSGGRSASTGGTCYKCNQPGHWARDCSAGVNVNVRQWR